MADDMMSFEDYGDRLRFHILKNYEPARYADYGFPAEAKFELPKRPAPASPLLAGTPAEEEAS